MPPPHHGRPLGRRALRGGLERRSLGLRGSVPRLVSCKAPRNLPPPLTPCTGAPPRLRAGDSRAAAPRPGQRLPQAASSGGVPGQGRDGPLDAPTPPRAGPALPAATGGGPVGPGRRGGGAGGGARAGLGRSPFPGRAEGSRLPSRGGGGRGPGRPVGCLGSAPGFCACPPRHLSWHPRAAPGVSPQRPGDGEPRGAVLPAPAPREAAGLGGENGRGGKPPFPSPPRRRFCRQPTEPPPSTQPLLRGSTEPFLAGAASPPARQGFQALTLGGRQAGPPQARIWPCRERGTRQARPWGLPGCVRPGASLSALCMHPHGYCPLMKSHGNVLVF